MSALLWSSFSVSIDSMHVICCVIAKVRGSLRRVGFSFTANTLICQIEIRFTSQRNQLNQLGLNDSMFKSCYWYCAKKSSIQWCIFLRIYYKYTMDVNI